MGAMPDIGSEEDCEVGHGERRLIDDDLAAYELVDPVNVSPDIATLGGQLKPEAREWYLAELVRIALADGPLTGAERAAAEAIAAELGMTRAQAYGVIMMTEQAANQD